MKCKICNKELHVLGLPSHLSRVHKKTVKEYYDLFELKEGENYCRTCGNPTNFISFTKGYRRFCCVKCGNNNEEIKQQIKNTNIKNHDGVPNGRDANAIKKYKETSKKNWGTENPMQNEQIKKKVAEAHNKSFGCHYLSTEECREKSKSAQKEKYGVEYYMQSSEFFNKSKETWVRTMGVNNPYKSEQVRKKAYKVLAENAKNHSSKFEKSILEFIRNIMNCDVLNNTYDIIFPYELDIYIPSIQLGIECNGTWYHSVNHDRIDDRILNKSLICRKNNIRLIHIFEFEDLEKQKQLLYSLLVNNIDRYNENDFNKNNLIEQVPKPYCVYNDGRLKVYGAGKLY